MIGAILILVILIFLGILGLKSELNKITKQIKHMATAIADFAAAQDAFNTRLDAAIDGLAGDIKTLNDEIAALQTSSGTITPEDQATLDRLEANAKSATEKLEALDSLTPPTVPPVVPTP